MPTSKSSVTGPPAGHFYGLINLQAVVGRSSRAMVVLQSIRCFKTGALFEFTASATYAESNLTEERALIEESKLFDYLRDPVPANREYLFRSAFVDKTELVPLQLIDGRVTRNLNARQFHYDSAHWLAPLPRVERIRVEIDWPAFDIRDASIDLDGHRVERESRSSVPFEI